MKVSERIAALEARIDEQAAQIARLQHEVESLRVGHQVLGPSRGQLAPLRAEIDLTPVQPPSPYPQKMF